MFRSKYDKQRTLQIVRLHEIGKAINSELDLDRLLKLIMDIVIDLTGAERGFLILHRAGKDRIVVARNMDKEEVQRPSFKISHSIVERVRRTGKAILTNDAQAEEELSAFQSVSDLRLKSILCVPFRIRNEVIGTLYLDHRFEKGTFTDQDLQILEMFSDQAAVAIENARLYEENRKANEELAKLNRELQEKVRSQEREIGEIRRRLDTRRTESPYRFDYGLIVGRSPAIRRVFDVLERIIETDLPVLLLGESGTGKELVARVIHSNGPRKSAPFVSENCGAIPESLMESEVFGFVRGAFTGAIKDRPGLLELAHRGTLFLDEIAEMGLSLQKKLLRALQDGEFRKIGGDESVRVDVRIISATNQDLDRLVAEKSFRMDLYYRLKGVVIELPPLRERREDILLLVDHFLGRLSEERGGRTVTMTPRALEFLFRYSWPGNVRELENELRRMAALAGDTIDADIAASLLKGRREDSNRLGVSVEGRTLQEIEREAIVQALRASNGQKAKAAEILGIPRRTFYDKLKRHRISES